MPRLSYLRYRSLACAAAVLALGGCSFAPAERLPAPAAALPEAYAQSAGVAEPYRPLEWWRTYDSPELDTLLAAVLAANLDLAEAAARVEEVRARYRIERAALFPGLSASADAAYSNQPAAAAFGGAGGGAPGGAPGGGGAGMSGDSTGGGGAPDRFELTTYSASLGLSYELDVWGRLRSGARAALLDARATADDYQAVQLAVLAESIATFAELVELQRRIALAVETVDVLAERVALAERRYERGLSGSFELYQLRQDFRSQQAQLPLLEAQLVDARGRIAVLAGRPYGGLDEAMPDTPTPLLLLEPVPAGLPAALLFQRPDVRAAARRFEAARHRVGARRAALLPQLTLSGELGLTAVDDPAGLADLDNWFARLTGGLTAPLFQGGRLRAGVDAAEAQYAQQAAAYGRLVLTALSEAEAALAALEQQQERYRVLDAQRAQAAASVELQAERYAAGLADYAAYLDALRNLLGADALLAQAGRAVALARLGVHRALGGGWTADGLVDAPAVPLLDRPVPTDAPQPDADP